MWGGWGEGLFIARCEEKAKGPLLPPSRACLARVLRAQGSHIRRQVRLRGEELNYKTRWASDKTVAMDDF